MKRFTTILNYLGLTLAFAAFIVVAVQVKWDATFNHAFPEHENLYRMEGTVGPGEYWAHLCRPIIKMTEGLEGIEASGTLSWAGELRWSASQEPDAPLTSLTCNNIDKAAILALGLEIKEGSIENFDSIPTAVIISDKTAQLFFPGESAVGKQLFTNNGEKNIKLDVVAVFAQLPDNSWPRCEVYSNLQDNNMDWSEWSYTNIMRLSAGASPDSICHQLLARLEEMGVELIQEDGTCPLRLTRLDQLHFSSDVMHEIVPQANRATLITLSTAALVILIIALINFFNISMAGVPAMIRTINTRKVFGAMRGELVGEQLLRTLFVSLTALATAVGLVRWLAGTSFAQYISGSLDPADNQGLVAAIAVVALVTSLLAGTYPALYSTSLPPAMAVKGGFAHSSRGRLLRNILVGIQLTISLVLITFALFIKVQADFMQEHDKGFASAQVLHSWLPNNVAAKQEALTSNLKKHPEVLEATYSNAPIAGPDGIMMTWGRMFKGTKINFPCLPVAVNFCDFFGIKVEEGRGFLAEDLQCEEGRYIFNRTAAEMWDIHPGERMQGHSAQEAGIVGIVGDFNFKSLQYAVEPAALYCFGSTPWRPLRNCYLRVAPGVSLKKANQILLEECERLDGTVRPEEVKTVYLDEALGNLYKREQRLGRLIFIACGLSVLISIIGILGIIHYETQFRRREIGIRRVMGATVCDILLMLNATYIKTLALCFLISTPISLAIIRRWLQDYAYQAPVPLWIFLTALSIVLAIIIASVTLKSLRTALLNPVETVKGE